MLFDRSGLKRWTDQVQRVCNSCRGFATVWASGVPDGSCQVELHLLHRVRVPAAASRQRCSDLPAPPARSGAAPAQPRAQPLPAPPPPPPPPAPPPPKAAPVAPARLLDGDLEDALGAGPPRVRRTRGPCMLGRMTACLIRPVLQCSAAVM